MRYWPRLRADPRVTLRAMGRSTFATATLALRVMSRVVPVVLEVLDDNSEITDHEAITAIVVQRVTEEGGPQVGVVTARTLSLLSAGIVSLAMDLRGRT